MGLISGSVCGFDVFGNDRPWSIRSNVQVMPSMDIASKGRAMRSDALGVDQIDVVAGDTSSIPYGVGTIKGNVRKAVRSSSVSLNMHLNS